jgi:hypothetical protein
MFGVQPFVEMNSGEFGKKIRNRWKSCEMRCRRRLEKIRWNDRLKNQEVLQQPRRK